MTQKYDRREQAMEDLGIIRRVLDQTATSFRTLTPAFRRLGLLWLIVCLPHFLLYLRDVMGFYFPNTIGELPALRVAWLSDALRLLLLAVLVFQCLQWQRSKRAFHGFDRKLLTFWQVLLLAFLLVSVVVEVGMRAGQGLWYEPGDPKYLQWGLCVGLSILQTALFPGLPLVITGVLLEERLSLVLGLLMGAYSLCILLLQFFPQPSGVGWVLSTVGIFSPLFPPVSILLLAWRLGKRPEGG